MSTDDGFLMQLSVNPADDTTRLVYADWLEEQGDSVSTVKAEFLRLTVQFGTSSGKKLQKKKRAKRLQQLAAGLDTDWLVVVSRLAVENCQAAVRGPRMGVRFNFRCDWHWEDLSPT